MARKEPVPDRERGIGFRLEEFRRSTKIPRTTFALTIGISGERLASYEKGRVPLRYGVFKAINRYFHIRLDWLMNARGSPATYRPFDDSRFAGKIDENELLSVVYDTILSGDGNPDKEDAEAFFFGPGGLEYRLGEFERIVKNPKECRKISRNYLLVFIDVLESVLKETRKAVERDLSVEEKYQLAMTRRDREKGKQKG